MQSVLPPVRRVGKVDFFVISLRSAMFEPVDHELAFTQKSVVFVEVVHAIFFAEARVGRYGVLGVGHAIVEAVLVEDGEEAPAVQLVFQPLVLINFTG